MKTFGLLLALDLGFVKKPVHPTDVHEGTVLVQAHHFAFEKLALLKTRVQLFTTALRPGVEEVAQTHHHFLAVTKILFDQ